MATDEEKNKMAIVMLIFSAYVILKRMKSMTRAPIVNRDVERRMMLRRMYKESDNHCHEQLRMKRNVFYRLCDRLRAHGLVDRRSITVKEQVAMFLTVIAQDASNREGKFRFIRSGQTISRYFHTVLRAVISMYKEVVKPARRSNSPLDGGRDEDWYDYFEDAVGAIDGTYINATVPMDDQPRYRNRKGQIRQNVLVACTFDMKLTYSLRPKLLGSMCLLDGRVQRTMVVFLGMPLDLEMIDLPCHLEWVLKEHLHVLIGRLHLLVSERTQMQLALKRKQHHQLKSSRENKYKSFKDNYRDARKVERNSGLNWDPHTERVTADPLAWLELVEKGLDAEKFCYKKVPYYDDLSIIVGDDAATGEGGATGLEADNVMPPIGDIDHEVISTEVEKASHQPTQRKRKRRNETNDSSIDLLADVAQRMDRAMERPDISKLQEELLRSP